MDLRVREGSSREATHERSRTERPDFKDVVGTLDELRALMGEPSEIALRKDIGRIDEHCRAFIARAPFLLVATADRTGRCDVSPKGDAPGFVPSWTTGPC